MSLPPTFEEFARELYEMSRARLSAAPRTHPDDPGEPQHGLPRIGIAPDEEAVLLSLHGDYALDIGTGLGFSARALAACNHAVYTVDPDPWVQRTIWPTLPGNVRPVSTIEDVPIVELFDVVFIDGIHTAKSVRSDFISAVRRTKVAGIVLLHDWRHVPDVVAPTIRQLVGNTAPIVEMPTSWGLGFVVVTPRLSYRIASGDA